MADNSLAFKSDEKLYHNAAIAGNKRASHSTPVSENMRAKQLSSINIQLIRFRFSALLNLVEKSIWNRA